MGVLDKNTIKELMDRKGEVRGVTFQTDQSFIKEQGGTEMVKRVEQVLKKAGAPLVYKEIKEIDFYPIGLRMASLLAIKETLSLSEEDIEQMGRIAPKHSWIIKLFSRFFFSIQEMTVQAEKMWGKHYTVGKLEAEADEDKRTIEVTVKELDLHPLFCLYVKGYFSAILQMTVGQKVQIKHTQCPFKNKDYEYHKYEITW